MLKRTCVALSVAALSLAGTAFAQESATVTLRSGEKLSAELMDLGGVGFTVKVNGAERQIPANDVAAIDFTGGLSDSDYNKLSNGQALILKSGETVNGQLVDIGGSSPLRLTFKKASGEEQDYASNDVARIILARPNASSAGVATTGSAPGQGITVNSQQQWTSTGISVRRGQWVVFNSSGEIHIGGDGNPASSPNGVGGGTLAPGAPLAQAPAGALIGRVGNSQPFLIGGLTRVQMPASGILFLGVNDGHLPDNTGSYQVEVTPQSGR
jgi:hypothetical protein